jgi:peptide/nickel transport system substrate-binding protein
VTAATLTRRNYVASTAKRGRWYRRVSAVMALALLATACGGGGDSGGGGDTAGGDEGTPTPGGRVVYGLEAETADGWCLP